MKGGPALLLGHLFPLAAGAVPLAAGAVPLAAGPLAAQTAPPAEQAGAPLLEPSCREVLAELDRAFASGDPRAYLDLFAPEQQWLHAVHRRAIELRLLQTPPRRTSELLAPPRRVGPRTVLMVGTTTTAADGTVLRERSYVVLRPALPGEPLPRPVLAVEVPPQGEHCTADDTFKCEACNYRIGGVAGWLCAPAAQERTGGVEGAVFALLGSDVALETSVSLDDEALPAERVVDALVRDLREQIAGAEAGLTTSWSPPSLRGREPKGCAGARADVTLPGGQQVSVFAHVLGRLRHVLLLRGARLSLQREQTEIDALLSSYSLLSTEGDLAGQAAKALARHAGGLLDGGRYRNAHWGVAADGPQGWSARERCDGAAFSVCWETQGDGHMSVTGYLPPAGLVQWTETLADRWLDDCLRRAGYDKVEATPWCDGAGDGNRERERRASSANRRTVRLLRVLLRKDLLVVVDAQLPAAADDEAVRRALAGVQRR
jgi:hypothetical protein